MFGRKKNNLNIYKNDHDIVEIISKIKSGDRQLRERLIDDYKPFILKCVSKFMNKFIEVENSEEFSVALIAFDEAIDDFDEVKNCHFISFAELVIKRRLLNHVNKERKSINTYPFSFFDSEKDNPLENVIAEKSIFLHFDRFETREEILIFNKKLRRFGITLHDLVKKTPKHKDSKQMLLRVAKIITENDSLYEKLNKKMIIPMSDLTPLISINPKTVEKNRKYVIAACIAMKSDLDIIKGFLHEYLERG